MENKNNSITLQDVENWNPPYKNKLKILLKTGKEKKKLQEEIVNLKKWILSRRQVCDLELLSNGGFSPLEGFMVEEDYNGVLDEMRLKDGTLWPMPITLDVSAEFAKEIKLNDRIALEEPEEGIKLAVLTVESMWKPDKVREAEKVFGANDIAHPSVNYLHNKAGEYYLGGKIETVRLPPHYDFLELRRTPFELRKYFIEKSWAKIVAFQTRNPMHRSHKELTVRASREQKANLLLHPVVGLTKPGDVDHYTRVRCYKAMMEHYPDGLATLSLLPLAMRMAGPKEALWHAIIRRNYGASHFIVGRDHAGPGNNSDGKPFYGVYEAQELVGKHQEEIGMVVVPFKMVVYVEDKVDYLPENEVEPGDRVLNISGTELRRRLYKGLDIPNWFSFPEVVKILRKTYKPKKRQGFTLFFTGLSSSGKSTIATAIQSALLQRGGRTVTLLAGKHIRGLLSSELTFSKTDRDLSLARISYVASEISKAGGVAILTSIAPYKKSRAESKKLIEENGGGFVMIYLNTPLDICEKRDRKGNYKRARNGELEHFTGIDDPYEEPSDADVVIDTSQVSVFAAVQKILLFLETEGYFVDPSEEK